MITYFWSIKQYTDTQTINSLRQSLIGVSEIYLKLIKTRINPNPKSRLPFKCKASNAGLPIASQAFFPKTAMRL